MIGNPLRFEGRYEETRLEAPPLLGQHTREVLGLLIGLSDAEIDRLISDNVIAAAAPSPDHVMKSESSQGG